jgi:hypothetical protein
MNKPISKHALRRAMERVSAEGVIRYDQPIGGVVDRLWHEIEKSSYTAARKKPATRSGPRVLAAAEPPELDLP